MTMRSTLITRENLFSFWLKNRSYCSLGIIKSRLTGLKDFSFSKGMARMALQERDISMLW